MSSARLPPEVNRVLFVKNLPFQTTGDELYALFGRYGAIRQIRLGSNKQTKGSAFVIFEDILDAKTALENSRGFKAGDRYMTVLYYAAPPTSSNLNGSSSNAKASINGTAAGNSDSGGTGRKSRLQI